MVGKQINFRVSPELYEKLREEAERHNLSMGQWLKRLAEKVLESSDSFDSIFDNTLDSSVSNASIREELDEVKEELETIKSYFQGIVIPIQSSIPYAERDRAVQHQELSHCEQDSLSARGNLSNSAELIKDKIYTVKELASCLGVTDRAVSSHFQNVKVNESKEYRKVKLTVVDRNRPIKLRCDHILQNQNLNQNLNLF